MSSAKINQITDFKVADFFTTYVQIDTQSDPHSPSCPSTEKQKNLGLLLVDQLLEIGLSDAHMDEYGYVYATLPSNSDKQVPVICFCSHMDTSPDSSGFGVIPIVHKNYQGQDLVLPDDPSVVIRMAEHKDLAAQLGNDIITASGSTLLGADDKAGIAEIMDALRLLIAHPEIKHGTIKVLFTPDEEIGRGVDLADLKKLCAEFAYTLDGETVGSIEDETFSADGLTVHIKGISAHPGFAKGKMQSAIKAASAVVAALPSDRLSPESTSGKEGFVHPVAIQGTVEEATIQFIIRDFEDELLAQHEAEVEELVKATLSQFPGCSYSIEVKPQYRNMKQVLDQYPQIMEIGIEAIKRAGMSPIRRSIRGGTDGSRLSFMGLPCPNVFAGGHAFHSKMEWVSIQDMQQAVKTILHIANIWEERA